MEAGVVTFDFTDDEVALLISGLGWAEDQACRSTHPEEPYRKLRERLERAVESNASDEDLQRRADEAFEEWSS